MALEPIHHVAPVGPAHGARAVGIDVRKFDQFVGDLHQVFKNLAPMVSRDFSREVLAIAGRSMGIGESDDIAGAGINLPVTAKGILPLKLRPTVHVEDERIFFRRIEVVGLDDKNFNLRSVGSFDPHALGRTQVHFIGDYVVELRKALRRRGLAVSQIHGKNFDGVADSTTGVDDAAVVRGELEGVDGPVHQHLLNGAGAGVEGHAEDGVVAFERSAEVERLRV